jgi:hypothetical protein
MSWIPASEDRHGKALEDSVIVLTCRIRKVYRLEKPVAKLSQNCVRKES